MTCASLRSTRSKHFYASGHSSWFSTWENEAWRKILLFVLIGAAMDWTASD